MINGHNSVYPSVTVSMDIMVAVTDPDHPWMDTTGPWSWYSWLSQAPISTDVQ